ncbi:MAG: Holliday junction branch migration protein RuvA [Ignavibacteriaceae bacterium]|nr:Holliday junction branch migration protein RuvA [Ignavibacteriaceae bacterium]
MIGYLRGKILYIEGTTLIIDTGGVGYKVSVSANSLEKLSGNSETELFIYTNVKEDAIQLFGFIDKQELQMFELLITINGIGPKLALGILSGIQASDLQSTISTGNYDRLTGVPGVGRKTAERIILELRGKVDRIEIEGVVSGGGIRSEAIKALISLGYGAKIAEKSVREALEASPDISLEELVKSAIKKAFS